MISADGGGGCAHVGHALARDTRALHAALAAAEKGRRGRPVGGFNEDAADYPIREFSRYIFISRPTSISALLSLSLSLTASNKIDLCPTPLHIQQPPQQLSYLVDFFSPTLALLGERERDYRAVVRGILMRLMLLQETR